MNPKLYSLDDLLRIMQRLRDPDTGCPWDRVQTFATIVPSTLEECYELAAAIEAGDYPHLEDELGDVLFQVIFYAQLGSEERLFDFSSVVNALAEKLLRRHPHVFADGKIEGVVQESSDTHAVKERWEEIKASERAEKALKSALDDVPVALPALPRAQKLQKRAKNVGFDWNSIDAVFAKLDEERAELEAAIANRNEAQIEEELGDVLFTCVNLARHLKLDAESALRRASSKFERRFRSMEELADQNSRRLVEMESDVLEEYWQMAKSLDSAR